MPGFSIRNPYFIIVCALIVCLVGVTILLRMPVDMFPKLDLTAVVTATLYPGMPPEQVEKNITERQERFFTDPQRTALGAIYEQCAAAGCDRPFAWSELHHEQPWSRGGRTDIDDALPVCGHHHRLLHDPAYRHTRSRDPGTGRKVVTFHARM